MGRGEYAFSIHFHLIFKNFNSYVRSVLVLDIAHLDPAPLPYTGVFADPVTHKQGLLAYVLLGKPFPSFLT
jgi:hypothetical protein